jgi:hypothetical protein
VANSAAAAARTTFHLLLVATGTGSDGLLLANIYTSLTSLDTSLSAFLEELADLLDDLSGSCAIFTGDLNCLGDSSEAADTRLDSPPTCYNLITVNDGPTHLHFDGSQNKLDLMFERDDDRRLSQATTVVVGFQYHRLRKARLRCRRVYAAAVTRSYRDYKRFNFDCFAASCGRCHRG